MNLKLLGQGRTADVYEYDSQTILKLYKENVPRAAVDIEYRISKAVHSYGLRTPEPFELEEVDNRAGIIYQRISGQTMLHQISSRPWNTVKEAKRMANLHFSIHQCSVRNIPDQKESLKKNILATTVLTDDEKSKIFVYLDKLPTEEKLCHGDFHPDNILLDPNPWVIDWMTGTRGTPAADVARTAVILRIASLPPGMSPIMKRIIVFFRSRLSEAYIREYQRVSGLTNDEIEKWVLPVASARLVEWLPQSEKEKLVKLVRDRLKEIK